MNNMPGAADLLALAPLLVLSAGIVVLMLQIAVRRHLAWAYGVTLATFVLAGLSCWPALQAPPLQITPLLLADQYALLFAALFCFAGAVTTLIARDYLQLRAGQNEEFFLLLLLSTLGAVTLAYATHLASLLLGLELLGVALYALIAYPDKGNLPLEAAIKYLVLSGLASAILLFGFALLYAGLGTLSFTEIGAAMASSADHSRVLLLTGSGMVITGLAFKLSVVPFHMWTPDVYEGAPAPVSGFLAAVSKGAIFVVVLRWWLAADLYRAQELLIAVSLLAGASMLVGNLLALQQNNVKRLLAYSSIAHMGYLLIVLVACGVSAQPALALEAACYYLIAYIVTTLAAFSLLGLLTKSSGEHERDQISDLQGFFWREPVLALLFTVTLLSLAGIPLTAGFIAKFYLLTSAVDSSLWGLLSMLVIGSAIGIFYYLRVIYSMTLTVPGKVAAPIHASRSSLWTCYLLLILMLYLGIMPESLMRYLQTIL